MLSSDSARCVKYTLYFFNVFYFILGVASIAIGVFLLIDEELLKNLVKFSISEEQAGPSDPGLLVNICIIFLVVGSLMILISFIGCLGTLKEIKCLLAMYLCLVGVVFILQIVSLALAIVLRSKVSENLESSLYSQLASNWDNYYNSSDTFTKGYDYAMVYFECCGIRNYTEFQNRDLVPKWTHFKSQTIPAHCCKLNKESYLNERLLRLEVTSCPTTLRSSNIDTPCYDKIYDWMTARNSMLIILAAIGVALQMVGILLTCCLISCINDTYVKH